ncbi:hypothetical protein K469DRAFT_771439 [Zopfia rhizophila CBS 207.26]|uniref:Bacteriophage T5 Orf172 DNA-binding domain-containing protein n=1 Tax=Zopfia rhizophila CBS 207.26 TaxID=1314779 RepID=A0A6A6D8Y7_9PEZI|nr:hypothetical protein K469DRAFT_771439 [Zopfia rhizophila CBS 207.26]
MKADMSTPRTPVQLTTQRPSPSPRSSAKKCINNLKDITFQLEADSREVRFQCLAKPCGVTRCRKSWIYGENSRKLHPCLFKDARAVLEKDVVESKQDFRKIIRIMFCGTHRHANFNTYFDQMPPWRGERHEEEVDFVSAFRNAFEWMENNIGGDWVSPIRPTRSRNALVGPLPEPRIPTESRLGSDKTLLARFRGLSAPPDDPQTEEGRSQERDQSELQTSTSKTALLRSEVTERCHAPPSTSSSPSEWSTPSAAQQASTKTGTFRQPFHIPTDYAFDFNTPVRPKPKKRVPSRALPGGAEGRVLGHGLTIFGGQPPNYVPSGSNSLTRNMQQLEQAYNSQGPSSGVCTDATLEEEAVNPKPNIDLKVSNASVTRHPCRDSATNKNRPRSSTSTQASIATMGEGSGTFTQGGEPLRKASAKQEPQPDPLDKPRSERIGSGATDSHGVGSDPSASKGQFVLSTTNAAMRVPMSPRRANAFVPYSSVPRKTQDDLALSRISRSSSFKPIPMRGGSTDDTFVEEPPVTTVPHAAIETGVERERRETILDRSGAKRVILPPCVVDGCIRNEIEKDVPTKFGYVYILRAPRYFQGLKVPLPPLVKIGKALDVEKRINEIKSRCGIPHLERVQDNKDRPVKLYEKLEKLVHAELGNFRVVFDCSGKCQKRKNGVSTEHTEWFNVPEDVALKTVQRWRKFVMAEPYREDGKLKDCWHAALRGNDDYIFARSSEVIDEHVKRDERWTNALARGYHRQQSGESTL